MAKAAERRCTLSQPSSAEVVYGKVFAPQRLSVLNALNARRHVVVVGLAVDVGLVEPDTVGPLLLGVVYPSREVVCPVGRGCSADDEPHVAAACRAVEGDELVGVVVAGALPSA